jgi:hypothetical protein
MDDYFDTQRVHGDKIVDARIETVLQCIHRRKWSEPHLDTVFTDLCRDFINPDLPTMLVSRCGTPGASSAGAMYLVLMGFDFSVTHHHSNDWPTGGFPYMQRATVGVSIHHGDKTTDMQPGEDLGQASIAAVIQYIREHADEANNQGSLPLH